MFPSYRGNGVVQASKQLIELSNDFFIVPILNGLDKNELEKIAQAALPIFDPIIVDSSKRGVVDALIGGYKYILGKYPDLPIIRMDVDEHPLNWALKILEHVINAENSMIIGDLSFQSGMITDPVDEFIHLQLFPELYRAFSHGKLPLSCAHGFQAFCNGSSCEVILRGAMDIISRAEQDLGAKVKWGLDGAMALTAVAIGSSVKIILVPAIVERKRTKEKAMEQFRNHLVITKAAAQVFSNL